MTKGIFYRLLIIISILFIGNSNSYATSEIDTLPFKAQYYKDSSNQLDINQVDKKTFIPVQSDIFNFGVDNATFWLKFDAERDLIFNKDILLIEQARFLMGDMYYQKANTKPQITKPFNFFRDSIKKVPSELPISYLTPSKKAMHCFLN